MHAYIFALKWANHQFKWKNQHKKLIRFHVTNAKFNGYRVIDMSVDGYHIIYMSLKC